MSQSEKEERLLETQNARGESASQQGVRLLRELYNDEIDEGGAGLALVYMYLVMILQSQRFAGRSKGVQNRNGTGVELNFKCFGPGCGRSFLSKITFCYVSLLHRICGV